MENVTLLAIALGIPNKEDEFVKAYLDERDFELEDLIKEMVANDTNWKDYQSAAALLVVKHLQLELSIKKSGAADAIRDICNHSTDYKWLTNPAKYLAKCTEEICALETRIQNICADFAQDAWVDEYIKR